MLMLYEEGYQNAHVFAVWWHYVFSHVVSWASEWSRILVEENHTTRNPLRSTRLQLQATYRKTHCEANQCIADMRKTSEWSKWILCRWIFDRVIHWKIKRTTNSNYVSWIIFISCLMSDYHQRDSSSLRPFRPCRPWTCGQRDRPIGWNIPTRCRTKTRASQRCRSAGYRPSRPKWRSTCGQRSQWRRLRLR